VVPGRKLLTFFVRGGYALFLAVTFAIVLLIHFVELAGSGSGGASIRAVADTAQGLVSTLVTINLMACMLFTPAYVASAIAQEKDQRTMQDLLLTSMSAAEIVLSKLFGRLAQVLLVLATGMPLVAIGSLLGGVSGSMMLAIAAMTVLWLVTVGSFTLMISVLVRRTRDAILGSYALGAILLIGIFTASYFVPANWTWLQDILASFNPFTILRPAWSGASSAEVWWLIGQAGLVLGVFAAGSVGLTLVLLRPLGVRQLEVKVPRSWRFRRRVHEPPGETPMLWKEKHFPPSGWMTRLLHYSGLLATLALVVVLGILYWLWFTDRRSQTGIFEATLWMLMPGLVAWPLYLSMMLTTSSAFSGERDRGTWDAILTSALAAREIVIGKLSGAVWEVRWWLVAIVVCFVQGAVSAVVASESVFMLGGFEEVEGASLGRALMGVLVVFTGTMFGGRGVVGLVGEILFLLGVGLRTSLGCRTSGKSVGITLLIWIGSGIAFKIVVWIGYIAYFSLIFAGGINRGAPGWLGPTGQVIGAQLVWFGPLLAGLFWSAIGLWLLRRTIRDFDLLASRMAGTEVIALPLTGSAQSDRIGASGSPAEGEAKPTGS
jgi:ABC-type transport system involved in multi-copper enzyme maturation permease subunit